MYPLTVFHRTKGQRLVSSEEERLALGDGWHFDLAHCPAVAEVVAPVEDEGASIVMPEIRRRGRPPKVR